MQASALSLTHEPQFVVVTQQWSRRVRTTDTPSVAKTTQALRVVWWSLSAVSEPRLHSLHFAFCFHDLRNRHV